MIALIFFQSDLETKLNYAFDAYDLDGNGYLDQAELNTVLSAMFDMLKADKKHLDTPALVALVTKDLDSSRDGRVSKNEFVTGLMAQPNLRALLNPFT